MDRVAVFVDAGYMFAAGSEALVGRKQPRSLTELSIPDTVDFFRSLAAELTGLPLLRIYWYDGTDAGPSAEHTALAFSRDVKVRLGIVNSFGQQKGADSLIITDMINLAQKRAMASAVLVTGDEDLRIGMQHAQEYGVRVHLIGVHPARNSQSNLLLQEADATHELSAEQIGSFMGCSEMPEVHSIEERLAQRLSNPVEVPEIPKTLTRNALDEAVETILSFLNTLLSEMPDRKARLANLAALGAYKPEAFALTFARLDRRSGDYSEAQLMKRARKFVQHYYGKQVADRISMFLPDLLKGSVKVGKHPLSIPTDLAEAVSRGEDSLPPAQAADPGMPAGVNE